MERYPRFTIMQFADPKIWQYMGRYSGRDGDKAAALGLQVAYTDHGTPASTPSMSVRSSGHGGGNDAPG